MTQPRGIVSTLFAALALAAIAAGCSGNGSHSLPATPGPASDAAARHRKPVGAILRIHIPPRQKHRRRGAQYVSPNTQSLTVDVQEVTASPWPALPTQTLVVNTPRPCVEATGDSGLTCTFAVKAYVGKNVFTFNEYATKSPTPQDTPLGTLTTGATSVTSGGAALNFALHGVVHRVELSVPNPESTLNAASKRTEPIPIGTAAAFPVFVNPEDASGASIATDTFSSPVTIQVSTANSGVSLSLNKQCAGDTSSATKVTLNCASDLNNVTIEYDGTVTQTGTNGYVDSAQIVASPQLASPTAQPATVALTSNLLAYQLVAAVPTSNPYIDTSNVALDPVSGKMVFAFMTNNANPTFVEFDPTSPAAAPATHAIGFGVRFLIFDAAGHLWTNDTTSPALHCFTSISAAGATIGITDVGGGINEPFIAPDASGNLWYSGIDATGYPAVGSFADSCVAASHTAQFHIDQADETPEGLALALPSAGNAAVGMVTDGDNFYTMNTATAASPTPAASWPGGENPGGLVNDAAYNIYSASTGTPVVNKIAAGTTNIQTLVSLPPGSYPYGMDQYSGTQATAQAIAVVDDAYAGTALINPAAASTEPLEIVANDSYTCGGISYDKTGGVWLVCIHGDGSIWTYHPIVTSTWSAIPSAYDYSSQYGTVMTIAEKSGVDNSPFTVTRNTDPSVIATSTPWPPTARRPGFVVASPFPHAIPIEINSAGSDVLTITDKNGRAQSIVVVVSPSGVITGRHHHDRRRHGPKPQ